jgi:hypothetical protein
MATEAFILSPLVQHHHIWRPQDMMRLNMMDSQPGSCTKNMSSKNLSTTTTRTTIGGAGADSFSSPSAASVACESALLEQRPIFLYV